MRRRLRVTSSITSNQRKMGNRYHAPFIPASNGEILIRFYKELNGEKVEEKACGDRLPILVRYVLK